MLSVIFRGDSAVDIVARLQSGRWTNRGSVPGWSNFFFFLVWNPQFFSSSVVRKRLLRG
jgi:hypothetical protein